MMRKSIGSVLVTVGTTEFNELIAAVDTPAFVQALRGVGAPRLVVQIGRGSYVPVVLPTECGAAGIEFECFRLKDTLADDMQAADVIVSHCGSGSVLDAMSLHKTLVLVVNTALQDNHQSELARAMTTAPHNHALATTPCGVVEMLVDLPALRRGLAPYPEPDRDAFPAIIDSLFDWRGR